MVRPVCWLKLALYGHPLAGFFWEKHLRTALAKLGFEPIKVETSAGKLEYERQQRALSESARPLRVELIRRLENILA